MQPRNRIAFFLYDDVPGGQPHKRQVPPLQQVLQQPHKPLRKLALHRTCKRVLFLGDVDPVQFRKPAGA